MNRETKYYYPVNNSTKEVVQKVEAEYRGGIYHIPRNALQFEPLPTKKGFAVVAVFDESGRAINSKYIEDHRGIRIYNESDCTQSYVVSELGPVPEGFTPDEPLTEFDERIGSAWITNESDKYIEEYNRVDDKRRALYALVCDPLKMEVIDLMNEGKEAEAIELKQQAQAAKQKIKTENPWPKPPNR